MQETSLVITQPREGILTFTMKGLSFGVDGNELDLSCSGVDAEELLSWAVKVCGGGNPTYVQRDREVYTPFVTFEYTPVVSDGRVRYTDEGRVAIRIWHKGNRLSKFMKLSDFNKAVEIAVTQ